jgi:hypothetical protein
MLSSVRIRSGEERKKRKRRGNWQMEVEKRGDTCLIED